MSNPLPQAGPAPGDLARQECLLRNLARAMGNAELIETHISWVLLIPPSAYKFKKALRLDFVDYATLAAREFYCSEEIRLNSRLAPGMYLGVVRICGALDDPHIEGAGPVLEYGVKMRAFAQSALWERRLAHGQLSRREIIALADLLAKFHDDANRAGPATPWGTAEAVAAQTEADLNVIDTLLEGAQDKRLLARVREWHGAQARLGPVFRRRKAGGWVRECHGDLHCGNIITEREKVQVFDGIEFNDSLRWIDVMHDVAFLWMDLQYRGRTDLAARLLSEYLQRSGDYGGLAVLPYYRTQRALVRCKVALLRFAQLRANGQPDQAHDIYSQARNYLAFAADSVETGAPALIITHGFSGSGKSTISDGLVEPLGAVQIRSDVERKRMYLGASTHAAAAPGAGIYDAQADRATYRRLSALAHRIIAAGLPVLVDAAFLQRARRDQFRRLARRLRVPFLILDVCADRQVLEDRLAVRARLHADPSDADLAVLAYQLSTHDPLAHDELGDTIHVRNDQAAGGGQPGALAGAVKDALSQAGDSSPATG